MNTTRFSNTRHTGLLPALLLALSLTAGTTHAAKPVVHRPAKSARRAHRQTGPVTAIVAPTPSAMKVYVLRLRPGQDLLKEIDRFVAANRIRAGVIVSCVGSLQQASLRLANKDDLTAYTDKFEIVSLVGTLEPKGGHLHMALSDGTGKTIGGHVEGPNIVYTTAEIVIGDLPALKFARERDDLSTYDELVIRKR